ncbi:hypothetical protein ACFPL7_23490 [Dongia soli]|uniref:Uncharacterized protein n=1 Tax=Dongia soli TaxID=600628 RepID=A0ABU5EH21_9PROT|nr:hypothetical protein [Dongia soli]MDY0885661.1 hypothetical protein [Dongia soli]
MPEIAGPIEATGPYQTAAQTANSLLHIIRRAGGLSPDFWHDPFVLGFLFNFIHGVAVQGGATAGDYSDMPSVFQHLCGNDGLEVLERSTVLRINGDADYRAGGQAAEKFLDVIYRRRSHDDDPDVRQAHSRASIAVEGWDGPNRPDANNIFFACLLEAVFLDKIWQHVNRSDVASAPPGEKRETSRDPGYD